MASKTTKSAGSRKNAGARSNTGSRKTSAARTSSVKKNSSAARKSSSYRSPDPVMNTEILCWCLLGASAVMFICVIGFGGKIGNAFGDLLFGIMGTNAYLFPFLVFFLTLYLMMTHGERFAKIRAISCIVLFCVLCGVWQLISYSGLTGSSVSDYFEVGQQYHTGGGAIGGALILFFHPTVGLAGTWIVFIIAIFLFGALITQKKLFISAGYKGAEAFEEHRTRSEELRLEREELRLEREMRRREEREQRLREAQARRERKEREEMLAQSTTYKASPVFYSVLGEGDDAGSEVQTKKTRKRRKQLSTDLFGDTRKPKKNQEPLPALTPDQVVFETVRREDAAPDQLITSLPKTTFVRMSPLPADEKDSGQPAASVMEEEEDAYVPTFTIHRAGRVEEQHSSSEELSAKESRKSSASKSKAAPDRLAESSEEAPDLTQNEEPEEDAMVVTREDIQNAGVSESRKKAEKEAQKENMTKEETRKEVESVAKQIEEKQEEEIPYQFPSIDLLERPSGKNTDAEDDEVRETARKLEQVLSTFGVNARITEVSCGPSVTRYEFVPELGTKVSKITNLADDLKLNLAAADIRIEAPIPGKAAVGIEIPNKKTSMVRLRELIDSDEFRKNHSRKLSYVVGKDISGRIVVSDIAKMPHLLIAGATGSGKSVFINTLIMSIIYNADPSEVKMIMIDPKVVELSVYNDIPHLFIPVVTDPKKAAGALNWGVAEMTRRYQAFAEVGVRNLAGYNAKVETLIKGGVPDAPKKMPQIVIIVDELADLMMVSGNEVEDAICRLAQLARACGIHLVIATQRPSVDVITGLIKANIPSRIAFAVSSGTDSRTILDMVGAEKLLGNGDMLFAPQTYKKPVRVQGAFVSDEEIQNVVEAIRQEKSPEGQELMEKRLKEIQAATQSSQGGGGDTDELFAEAGRFIIQKDKASIGMLQRWFKIGFNRAARIMDQLSDAGVVGPDEGTKPRKVLMSAEQFENYLEQN